MKNREEWEIRGYEVVMEMVEAVVNAPTEKVDYMIEGTPESPPVYETETSRYIEC